MRALVTEIMAVTTLEAKRKLLERQLCKAEVGEGPCEVMFGEVDRMPAITSLWGQSCMSGVKS